MNNQSPPTDKDPQELREKVAEIMQSCKWSEPGGIADTVALDQIMALFTKAYKAKLHNLVTQANEFGAKAGSLEVGYAHLRDLMQEELSHTELQPHKEDES